LNFRGNRLGLRLGGTEGAAARQSTQRLAFGTIRFSAPCSRSYSERQYHSDPCHHRCLTIPAESLCCRNSLDALLAGWPDRGPLQHPLSCMTTGWEDRKIEDITCHLGRIVFKPLIYRQLSLPSSAKTSWQPAQKMATPPRLRRLEKTG
jgi:hypothetical protein